jgi:hypothetical protein
MGKQYYRQMQGELKFSLNFMVYFRLLQFLRNIDACHWGNIKQKLIFYNFWKCLEFFPYSHNGFPTIIRVKAYLSGTTKNKPPQIYRNVGFILINERTNFRKQFPIF